MTTGTPGSGRQLFAPAIAATLVAVGALSFLFYAVIAAYAPEVSGEADGRANALSRSAIGYAAFAEFLRAQNIPVIISRGLSASQFAKASLIIVTPALTNSRNDILGVTQQEPRLVVLPKWNVTPDLAHPGWVHNIGLYPEQLVDDKLLSSLSKSTHLFRHNGSEAANLHNGLSGRELKTGVIASLQTISGPDWIIYVTDAHGHALISRLLNTELYLLSDPDVLNTHGVADVQTARAAADIVQSMRKNKGPVVFDVTLAGYRRSPNFLRLIFEPPLLGASLCALVAALLMAMQAAVHFGSRINTGRVYALGKYALIDNSSALIALADREHRVLLRYAAAIRYRVARSLGISATSQGDGHLNELLDSMRPHLDVPSVSEIFIEASKARNGTDALTVARKLYRWREAMIHGR